MEATRWTGHCRNGATTVLGSPPSGRPRAPVLVPVIAPALVQGLFSAALIPRIVSREDSVAAVVARRGARAAARARARAPAAQLPRDWDGAKHEARRVAIWALGAGISALGYYVAATH